MMKGASSEQKKEWKMGHGQSFNWLPKAQKTLEGNRLLLSWIIVFVFILVVYSSFVIGLVCKLIFSFLFLAEDCFQETVEAMSHLGIKSDKQAEIFRVRF